MRARISPLLISAALVACEGGEGPAADEDETMAAPTDSGTSAPATGDPTSDPSTPPDPTGETNPTGDPPDDATSSGEDSSSGNDPSAPATTGPASTTATEPDSESNTSTTSGDPSTTGGRSTTTGTTGSPTSTTTGNTAECDPTPLDMVACPIVDLDNHGACTALEVTIVDGELEFPAAEVDDAVCDASEHWFMFVANAKQLYRVRPDGPANVEVFVGEGRPEDGPGALMELVNPFDPGAWHNRYFVPDGTSGGTAFVYVRLTTNAGITPTHLTIEELPEVFDCVDPYLTQHGQQHYRAGGGSGVELSAYVGGLRDWNAAPDNQIQPAFPGDGVINAQACRKTLNDPDDPSSGWASMEVVRCVDGSLEVVHDCQADYPEWSASLESEYGELLCNIDTHPGGQMWCEPALDADLGICALHEVDGGGVACVDDRWLFGCASNNGFLFDSDASLYNPAAISESGYPAGVDCLDAELQGWFGDEDERATCGLNQVTGSVGCLGDRELAANAELPEPASFPKTVDYAAFPATQNPISCGSPGEGNGVPYVELDPLSGVYTDHHVAWAQPYIDDAHERGRIYIGYLNAWGPERKTSWGPNPDNSGPWSTMTYQYGYWSDKLAADLGEVIDYAPYERGCWDADEDGVGNLSDLCPLLHGVAGADGQLDGDGDGIGDACDASPAAADSDPDGDGFSAHDNNGDGYADDNCPQIANPGQADSDHNGIGDACQGTAETASQTVAVTCDPGALSACVGLDGNPVAKGNFPMEWVMDLGQPQTQALLAGWTKLGAQLGMDGMTFDVALMNDCYGDANIQGVVTMLENGGHLDHDIKASVDPNDAARLDAYWELAEAEGGSRTSNVHPDWSGYDIRVERAAAESGGSWADHPARLLWELYKVDRVRGFMDYVGSEVDGYLAANDPGRNFSLSYNQGKSNNFTTLERAGETVELKDLAAAETFIRSGHPVSGASDCVGVEGDAYPVNATMEWVYALHQQDGQRFWSWNFPDNLPDDRAALFAAETYSAGGIYQVPFCEVQFHYPEGGYTRPHYGKRLAQAAVAPFVTQNWDQMGLPAQQGQVAFYWPQIIDEGCTGSAEFGDKAAELLFRTLREAQYTIDVLGRGPFGNGLASLPEVSEFAGYDFVVLAHRYLSDEEVARIEAYVASGGHALVLGDAGGLNEWCEDPLTSRAGWLGHFASFGTTAYGSGAFHQLDGSTAVSSQVAYTGDGGSDYVASDAFRYLEGPNSGIRLCDDAPLEVSDLPWAREQLSGWLMTQLAGFGLPASAVGGVDIPSVHVWDRVDTSGRSVYHLVNYALSAVPYVDYHDGDNAGAGNYVDRTAYFGCTELVALDGFSIPTPADLQASGGTATVALLDYEPPAETFFPFPDAPDSVCATTPIDGTFPSADNSFAFPQYDVPFGPGESEVVLDGVAMKQWAIVSFAP